MNRIKRLKGSPAVTVLNLVLFFPITAAPLSFGHSEYDNGPFICSSVLESWRKYDINADGKFDHNDINELINRGGQEISFGLDALIWDFGQASQSDESSSGVLVVWPELIREY